MTTILKFLQMRKDSKSSSAHHRLRALPKLEAEITLPQEVDPQVSNEDGNVYVVEDLSFPAANKLNVEVTVLK